MNKIRKIFLFLLVLVFTFSFVYSSSQQESFSISGNIVDVVNHTIYSGTIQIQNGIIIDITKNNEEYPYFILPGFIDAHVHIESSLLPPSEFARIAVLHGTVATVSDPHEIANVLGVDGVNYMLSNASKVPFKFYFSAPSCVPATSFETSGASINDNDIKLLLQNPDIHYLGEMMNFPGVIYNDPMVMKKIAVAKEFAKPIDGHSPGLTGENLKKYVSVGISTDHECFTKNEAQEKLNLGMKILIREGSAAKNFDTLFPLINANSTMCMLCSDDKHPNELITGHINLLVKKALANGLDIFKVLRVACVNPVRQYNLHVGLLQKGDPADFIIVQNLKDFQVKKTYINGILVADNGKTLIDRVPLEIVNNFNASKKQPKDFQVPFKKVSSNMRIIEAIDGQIVTNQITAKPIVKKGFVVADVKNDILKIAVINRYNPDAKPAIGFIKNFGLKEGAIASSVAHDSHNIIVVGTNDKDMCNAANLIIENKGGLSAVSNNKKMIFPLPIAGLMSDKSYDEVAAYYEAIDGTAKSFGSTLHAPFMTLSFMGLTVIPKLKLSDKGLFDGDMFNFVDLFVDDKIQK